LKIDRADLFLDLIREAAENAATFIANLDRDAFLADQKSRHAVAMCLIIIGENVAKLARHHPEFLAAHPETPWTQAIGLRNRIAHGYEDLDFDLVWRTAAEYLPQLLRTLPAAKPFEE
jgi:uncharacterized protein with HEPN domain